MEAEKTRFPEVLVLRPRIMSDERGRFSETWNAASFEDVVGPGFVFVQDNQSRSRQGVLRGLHYQLPPRPQGKLVRVVRGRVFDVAVDIRRSSSTFGEWTAVVLTDENNEQLWVPPGFAHGFLALTDSAEVVYKVTEFYSPEHDRSLRWDDPDLGIEWPLEGKPVLSDKDARAPSLQDAEVFA